MHHSPPHEICCLRRVVKGSDGPAWPELCRDNPLRSIGCQAHRPSESVAKPVRTIARMACRSSMESDGHASKMRRNSGSISTSLAASGGTAAHSAAPFSEIAVFSGFSGVVPFLSPPLGHFPECPQLPKNSRFPGLYEGSGFFHALPCVVLRASASPVYPQPVPRFRPPPDSVHQSRSDNACGPPSACCPATCRRRRSGKSAPGLSASWTSSFETASATPRRRREE